MMKNTPSPSKKNDRSEVSIQKAWHTVILVALFRAMTQSFKSPASLACRKYRLDNAFITGRGKKQWLVIDTVKY